MTTEDPITHACRLLREAAKELACCVSIDGAPDWANEPETKVAYDEHMYAALALEQWASAIGAGGVSGPLMGRASLSANAGDPVAWQYRSLPDVGGVWFDCTKERADLRAARPEIWEVRALYAAPPTAQAEGWISVDERLPEPNVEVLCAGRGWGNSFVTACYYDDERREWHPINTHWTDATGQAQYPTHWMPLPLPPTSAEGVEHG